MDRLRASLLAFHVSNPAGPSDPLMWASAKRPTGPSYYRRFSFVKLSNYWFQFVDAIAILLLDTDYFDRQLTQDALHRQKGH